MLIKPCALTAVLLCILLVITPAANGECTLYIKKDFSEPQAIFLNDDGKLLSAADKYGAFYLRTNSSLTVACPGDNTFLRIYNDNIKEKAIKVRCTPDKDFSSVRPRWTGPLAALTCTRPPYFTAEYSGTICYDRHEVIRVGYKIQNKLHKLYEVCFDNDSSSAIYVSHHLGPASAAFQRGKRRPRFSTGGFYERVPISRLYKKENQQERFMELFGAELTEKYLKRQWLTRGHLVARADQLMRSWQRATFLYINAAPQWSGTNQGNWQSLESALRNYTSDIDRKVQVYTGTYGVTTLADRDGHMRELYLHIDENNNEAVPVPMYFYKVVYDAVNKLGTAFVTVNNPHYSVEQLEVLSFCPDLCRNTDSRGWLRWKPDDVAAGYSFCCSVVEFRKTVRHLPEFQVVGVFT